MPQDRALKDVEELIVALAGGAATRWLFLTAATMTALLVSVYGFVTSRNFLAAVALGPAIVFLLLSLKSATTLGSVTRATQQLSVLLLSSQMQIARQLLKIAPDGSNKLVFMKISEGPVEVYRPIQWWKDDSMIVGAGEDIWTRFPAYREMLSEWIVSEDQDRVTTSLHLMKKSKAALLVDSSPAGSDSSQWIVDLVNKLAITDPRREDIELVLPS